MNERKTAVPKVRTTINPHEEIEVDDVEFADLDRMGLVLKGTNASTESGLDAAANRQVAANSTSTDDKPKG